MRPRWLTIAIIAVAVPRVAFAMQPCPPGTAPSMVGPLIVGLLFLAGSGYAFHRRRVAVERSARRGWMVAMIGVLLAGALATSGFVVFQSFAGRCV